MRSRLFGSGLFLVFSVSLTAFVLFLCASGVQAATYSWDPGTGTWTWDTTTYSNWYDSGSSSDILWPNLNTSVAEFGAGVPTPGRGTITGGAVLVAPGGVTANAMTFDITGYTLTGSTITLAGVAPTITVTTAGTTATIGDVIDGAAGLAKAGAGTLTLNGVNIYTGGTTITGILLAGNNSALSSDSVTINVAGGNQLQLGSGVNISNALTINGGGVTGQGALYVPTGNATYSGSINITAAASLGGHFATAASNNLLTIAGNNTITTSTVGVPVTVRSGYVLYSGDQSYTEGTTLANAGATIQFAKTTSMPALGTVAISSGTNYSTLAINVGGLNEFTTAGVGAGTLAGLLNGTGGSGGLVTLNTGSSIGIDTTSVGAAGTVTFAGAFSNTATPANTLGLVKLGVGTLELTNATATAGIYNGNGASGFPFVVRQGTLKLNGGALSIHAVTGEAVVGGVFTTANGAAGYDATLQVDSGALNVSGWLSVGRGNGVGGVSSNLILNNGATVQAANMSAGYNGGSALNLPKGSITLNNTSKLTITGNGVLNLAESAGSNMTMTLNNSAQLIASGSGQKEIGELGTGELDIKDTSNVNFGSGLVYVGYNTGIGTLNMTGGTYTGTGEMQVAGGAAAGAFTGGSGTVTISGGTMTLGSLTIGRGYNYQFVPTGTMTVNTGGTVNAGTTGDIILGFAGAGLGKLVINGGTFNAGTIATRWMMVGYWDTAKGEVDVISGNLNMDNGTSIKFNRQTGTAADVINQSGGNVTFYSDTGVTPGGGGALDMMLVGAAASNNTYNLNGGTITVPSIISTTNNGTRTFNFNGGTLRPTGANANFITLGTGTAVANVRNNGGIIDSNGYSITIAQPLLHSNVVGDLAIDGGMTFKGTASGGTTLSGLSTYTGQTTVSSGTLTITGTLSGGGATLISGGTMILSGAGDINSSSGITINGSSLVQNSSTVLSPTVYVTKGTLDGTTTVTNAVVNAGTGIVTNGGGGTGALTVTTLTFLGPGKISTNTSSPGTAGLNVTNLNVNGGVGSVTVDAYNATWLPGLNNLVSYGTIGGTGSGFAAFVKGTISGLSNRQSVPGPLSNVANNICITVVGDLPRWTGVSGGVNNGNWTTNTAVQNWQLIAGGGATWFITGDRSLFDDNATGATTIDIVAGGVSPQSVTFNNGGLSYIINAGNPITGASSLSMTGAGTTTLNNSNTYTGGTTSTNGTLIFAGNNNFGTGTVNVSGGTLTLSGNNTYTGATTVNSGILNINNDNAIGSGTLNLSGGTIDNTSGALRTLAANNAQNWNGDFTYAGSNDLNLGTGAVTLTANPTVTTNGGATLTVGGVIGGVGLGFGKSGAGTMVLTAVNTYSGSTLIHAGTLSTSGVIGTTTANIQISPDTGDSGTLYVSGGTVNADRVIIGGNTANTGTPGDGTLTLTNGTINSREWFTVGSGGGTTAPKGTLNMSGGTINLVTMLFEVTDFANTSAEVNMSGGAINLQTNTSLVYASNPNCASGTFTQTGGTVTFYSDAGTTVGGTGILQLGRSGTLPSSSTYTYNLNGGKLIVPEITRNTATGNASSGVFNFNGGTLVAAKATTTWMHDLSSASIMENGAIIDDGGYAVTIAQNLQSGAFPDGGLTKQGTGTLTLSGASYWYGPTVVTDGTMAVTGSIGTTSAVTISGGTLVLSGTGTITTSGGGAITINGSKLVQISSTALSPNVIVTTGTLDGTGTISNTVTVGNGTGGIIANGNGGTGALTIGSLTFDGTATVNLNTASTSPVLITTDLTTSGGSGTSTGKITLNAANASWTSGTVYDLISYSSLLGVGNADFLKGTISGLTPRQSATLTYPVGYIALSVSAVSGGSPIWTGKVNNKWTTVPIGGLGNWQIGGVATDFLTGDAVVFDDTATDNFTVNISDANVSPTSATFNNGTKSYIITSTASPGYGIATGFVVKNGTGTVTITTSNTYAGGTTVNAGTLNINNASAIGTGVLTMTGGTIDATAGNTVLTTNNAQNWNGDFTFKGTNSLNVGTGDVTLGASPTVTVTAGTLGVGSIPVATTGYGLTKAGTGTLSLTSTAVSNIDGTLNIQAGTIEMGGDMYVTGLTGSGTLQAYSTVGKWFFVNNSSDYTFSGVIQDASGYLGLNKNGSGKLTLTGANNYTLATTVQEGTLVFSGTNNSTQYEGIGITAAADGVLILTSGSSISVTSGTAVWSSSMSIGNNATGAGDLRVVSGSSLTTSQQLAVGALGYGAFSQSAGLTTIGGFIAVGNGGVGGILNLSGGTINCPNAPVTTGGNWNSSNFGVINLSGNAVMNLNGAAGNGFWVGEFGTGILNMSGNAALNINSGGTLTSGGGLVINNMQHGTGYTAYGTVNLCGGTITTPFVTNGDAGTGTSTFNFNGGTLKANASTTTFMSGLTNAYVYNGGAIIDDGGKNITIGQALLAPTTGTGNGVSATGLTFSGGGCIDTPLVTISGDGTGATAVANITYNSVTGLYDLTGITITNPGVNYTTAPTFSLVGGGIDNTASIGGAATLVTNVSGGLTKLGAGTTTLSGVNTYTGTTTVSNGILQAAITGSLPNYGLAGKVKVSTGATIAVNAGGLSSDWVASEVNTLDSSAAYSGGSYIGFDTTNATGSFTYSYAVANPLSGTKGLKKLGTNTLVLDATNTYSGATIVNNGTLELSSLGQINTASAISTTATTATFQVDGGTHTVGNISGTGTTSVLSGSLTATSVDQGTVTIGAGATLTIAAIPGGPGSGGSSLAPVPEPATWAMLMMAAMGLGIYWRRRR